MFIFIDTNVFFNHWYLRAPMFNLLANYMSNEGVTLLISDVVRREIEAKFHTEETTVARDLAKLLRRAEDFQAMPTPYAPPVLTDSYDFGTILQARFDSVEFIPFEKVSHSELVARAISAKRPFRDGEKGYRDTLIWLSLLHHLKNLARIPKKLFFINANSNDFFEKEVGGGIKLHTHLNEDWKESGLDIELIPYLSLKEFVDKEVDLVLHNIRHDEFEQKWGPEMEDLAAKTAMEFLQEMPLPQLQRFLEDAAVPRRCARLIRSFSVEDFEGLEDPEMLSLSKLNDGSLYVRYRFNLLTVIYTVEVSTEDYLSNVDDFDESFMNIEVADRMTRMELYRRCDFEASFSYLQKSAEFTSVSIDFAALRWNLKCRRTPHISPGLRN